MINGRQLAVGSWQLATATTHGLTADSAEAITALSSLGDSDRIIYAGIAELRM